MSVSVITQHVCHIAGMVVDGMHNQMTGCELHMQFEV